MLACLPGPGDLSFQLLSYPQMNAGLQKWDTTQKMRATQHPTPAELDAYAKKVANHPLTIKIFPNSIKVPQRKHIRRTVNGLDTSGQRYSPYPPPQAAVKTGLLAIVRSPAKGVVKDFDGKRTRLLPDAVMNPPSAPYAAPSTLSHPQALARQQALRQLHPQGIPPAQPQPHSQNVAHPALQQLQHPPNHLQQQQHPPLAGMHGGRKIADADAPPNVTVSTSTIPLSMAATLQQNPPPDLSSIVHQIHQFCQARTGVSATSVCEGQIANPSPISRSLLISASTRVSAHNVPTPLPSCVVNPGDHATPVPPPAATMGVPLGSVNRGPPAYQSEMKQVAAWNQHQLAHLQQMCGEAIGPSGPMGKPPGRELPGQQGFAGKGSGYALELCMAQPFGVKPPLEKPTPSPPLNGLPGPVPFTNGHYFQPLWNNVLPTPNSDSSGSQDLPLPFHGGGGGGGLQTMGAAALECTAAPHCRAGTGAPSQGSVMQTMEYLSGDFHRSCLQEQGGAVLSKAARPPANRGRGPTESRSLHLQHPGYR